MKVTNPFLQQFRLNPEFGTFSTVKLLTPTDTPLSRNTGVLTAREVHLMLEYFRMLDTQSKNGIDDVEFRAFMSLSTDLTDAQIDSVFDIFDIDRSGTCEFDEVPFVPTFIDCDI